MQFKQIFRSCTHWKWIESSVCITAKWLPHNVLGQLIILHVSHSLSLITQLHWAHVSLVFNLNSSITNEKKKILFCFCSDVIQRTFRFMIRIIEIENSYKSSRVLVFQSLVQYYSTYRYNIIVRIIATRIRKVIDDSLMTFLHCTISYGTVG